TISVTSPDPPKRRAGPSAGQPDARLRALVMSRPRNAVSVRWLTLRQPLSEGVVMGNVDRRTFLAMLGAPAVPTALPQNLSQALAIAANNRSRSIQDVEHVIFLMQENRSFDHYFGTLRGVRGFADPHPMPLPSGKSVWHQPNGATDLLPFRPDVRDLGRTFLPDPPHGWTDTHAAC